ncbi:MAG: APC family permease [SAR202 cluster bacterium]|nr:APC family permease [SAR202 cluster bacterium]
MRLSLKHLLLGNPLTFAQAKTERLGIPLAFVIVAADSLSSTAYTSEEILRAFQSGGVMGQGAAVFVGLAIIALLFTVLMSYDRVIRTYPGGGGAYVVAKENLGILAGVAAGASLLIDYVLTVAVSVSAGSAAIVSAFPEIAHFHIELAAIMVGVLVLLNLRGVRQSARVLSIPVYTFVGSMFLMIVVGIIRHFVSGQVYVPDTESVQLQMHGLSAILILRAFSSGSVALTGMEAISNSMGVFRPPEVRHARRTLLLYGLVLGSLFVGVTSLAFLYKSQLAGHETLVSQIARTTFGTSALYYLVQFSTMAVLIIAANTAFVAFPHLGAKLAKDRYLPRLFGNLNDRFAYNNGILVLGGLATLLIFAFRGQVHFMIPLYAIGVFIGFTLTQTGMAAHAWKTGKRKSFSWFYLPAIGAATTAVITFVFLVVKFGGGAWVVLLVIPLVLLVFWGVRDHYKDVAKALSMEGYMPRIVPLVHQVIVPVGGVHRAIIPALEHARSLDGTVRAVHVATDVEVALNVQRRWARLLTDIPLIVVPAPRTDVLEPLLDYIHVVARSYPNEQITVVVPEFVPRHWWQHALHNRTAKRLKEALHEEERIIVSSVPFHLPE